MCDGEIYIDLTDYRFLFNFLFVLLLLIMMSWSFICCCLSVGVRCRVCNNIEVLDKCTSSVNCAPDEVSQHTMASK